eukprot:12990615-Alexandrium_andersonii.AAC.1
METSGLRLAACESNLRVGARVGAHACRWPGDAHGWPRDARRCPRDAAMPAAHAMPADARAMPADAAVASPESDF